MTTTVYKGGGSTVTLDTAAGTLTLKHGMGSGVARFAERHQVLFLADLDRVEEIVKGSRTEVRFVVAGTTPTVPAADDPLGFRVGVRTAGPLLALINTELAHLGRGEPTPVEAKPSLLKPSASLRAEADAVKAPPTRAAQKGRGPGVFEPLDAKPLGGRAGGGGLFDSLFGGGGE